MELSTPADAGIVRNAADRRALDRRFYSGMAIAGIVTVLIGFGRTYYQRGFTEGNSLAALVHVHGAVFLAWMVLLIVQTRLVATKRIATHKRVGYAGLALAALMLILGYLTAIAAARRGFNAGAGAFADALAFMAVTLGDLLIFAVLVALAVVYRRRAEVHKRLMLLATIGALLPAAISRLPFVTGNVPAIVGVTIAFLAAGPIFDLWTRRRIHPVYAWGVPIIFALMPIRIAIGATPWWHTFTAWLTR